MRALLTSLILTLSASAIALFLFAVLLPLAPTSSTPTLSTSVVAAAPLEVPRPRAVSMTPVDPGPWDGVFNCESTRQWNAINPSDTDGRPKYGGLQFDQTTWDWVAGHPWVSGMGHLVGVRPDLASAGDQLLMAHHLAFTVYDNGLWNWPHCGQYYNWDLHPYTPVVVVTPPPPPRERVFAEDPPDLHVDIDFPNPVCWVWDE